MSSGWDVHGLWPIGSSREYDRQDAHLLADEVPEGWADQGQDAFDNERGKKQVNRLKSFWYSLAAEKEVLRTENEWLKQTNAALEAELAAMRIDNRLLVNAQLKQSGIVSLPDLEQQAPPATNRIRRMSLHQAQRDYAYKTSPARKLEEAANGTTKQS